MTQDKQRMEALFKEPFNEQTAPIYREQMRNAWHGSDNFSEHVEKVTNQYHGMPGQVGLRNEPASYIRLIWIDN